MGSEFVQLSLTPLLIAIFASIACAVPGTFLLLRREALISDAIGHVVLPGIVVAFIFTGTIASWPMMIGAGAAALVAVALIEALKRLGNIEPGAAMGVVFTTLFGAGVLILEQTDTSDVHIDVQHALEGNLESLIWLAGRDWGALLDPAALARLPDELIRVVVVCAIVVALAVVFWRPLKIATFDEGFARTMGIPTRMLSLGLVMTAAAAAVAAFDAVGICMVIALFVCPPAAARLMSDRLETVLFWAVTFGVMSAVLGYVLAGYGPMWIGHSHSVSAAGMIATVAGVTLALAALFGPCRSRTGEAAQT
jgi:manganese/zinc/iron transport system permease protein